MLQGSMCDCIMDMYCLNYSLLKQINNALDQIKSGIYRPPNTISILIHTFVLNMVDCCLFSSKFIPKFACPKVVILSLVDTFARLELLRSNQPTKCNQPQPTSVPYTLGAGEVDTWR